MSGVLAPMTIAGQGTFSRDTPTQPGARTWIARQAALPLFPLRRAGMGGGNAAAADPYASESWEHACHEGNGHHVEGAQKLGFKWYPGAKAPGR